MLSFCIFFLQARLCRLRIEALGNRNDKQLTTFANIARNLEQLKFGAALKLCKEMDYTTISLRFVVSVTFLILLFFLLQLLKLRYR